VIAAGTLYLVPTPIGHPDDITLRAIEVLRSVDVVAAEDTRNAAQLLRRLGLGKPILSYFDHNERQRAPQLLGKLQSGQSVAVISDAGMPMLNDPGYHVLKEALAAEIPVVVLPGPSAIPTALVASGLPTTSFLFAGFLPRDAGPRADAIRTLASEPHTLVWFESPHRIRESLESLLQVLGDRRAALAFELTKERERIHRGPISSILGEIVQAPEPPMGEITLVVAGAAEPEIDWSHTDKLIGALLARGMEPRAIRDVVTDVFEIPKRAVYQRVLEAAKTTRQEPAATENDD
jgi:16S rRNA (cytidine1402-2'-O)-methyltransferase